MTVLEKQPPGSLVSVIVPVFNDKAGLQACLRALCEQAYPKFEVIVVDNGSSPPIVLPAEHFPFIARIVVCRNPGSYAARNAGVNAATGQILAFTDADCTPAAAWIERGVAALANDERVIVGGNVLFDSPKVRSGTELYQYETGFQQRENIEEKQFSATANLFCTSAQFRAIGAFEEKLLSGGDREWAWRARLHGYRFVFAEDALVHTPARTSLRSAIRQARRVAAGRMQLKALRLDHLGQFALQPHRSGWQVVSWIMTRRSRSLPERVRMLAAATAIKVATMLEGIRLRLGGTPERR